jgi:hypothetical protein
LFAADAAAAPVAGGGAAEAGLVPISAETVGEALDARRFGEARERLDQAGGGGICMRARIRAHPR